MEEDSLHFWIIPICCLVLFMGIFVITLENQINVVIPNATLELVEMKNMSCDQVKAKDSTNDYWTPDNSAVGREMLDACKEAQAAESKRLKELEAQQANT